MKFILTFSKIGRLVIPLFGSTILFHAQAQGQPNPSQRIDTLFSKYHSNTPGVAVGVVKNGELIFSKGYGQANLEYDIPISPKTRFHVASVSKQFTAFAIYLLEERGLISFEDTLDTFFPEFPLYATTIKIKHLLAHTSGLRDQWALLLLGGWHMEDVITTEQILKIAKQQKALNFEPGTQFGYCNTSYTLLAEIVARVTGKRFSTFAQENIFTPLGMKDTQFYEDFHNVLKNRAYSYELKDGRYVKKKLSYSNVGPSSLFTTVEDLVKWSTNFDTHIVGNASLFTEFNRIANLDNGNSVIFNTIKEDTLYHAKGQILRTHRGISMIKHGGHDAGFRSFLARFPNEKMAIITLSNDEHYEIFARGLEITEFYLDDKMTPKASWSPKSSTTAENYKVEPISLESFIGSYYSPELDTTYHIKMWEDQLVISHLRLSDMPLTHKGGTQFFGNNYFNFELNFIRDDTQTVTGFEISNFGVFRLSFKKINPKDY